MIRSLRRRHRWMVATLALAGTVVLAVGLVQRQGPAVSADLSALETPPPSESRVLYQRQDVFPDATLEIEVRQLPGSTPTLQVGVRTTGPLEIAAGHLYWHPLPPTDGALAEDAYLLGPVPDGRWVRYTLPVEAEQHDGYLVLYSAGHDSVQAAALLPTATALRSDNQ